MNARIGKGIKIGSHAWAQTLGNGNKLTRFGENWSISREVVISSITSADHDHGLVLGNPPVDVVVSGSPRREIGGRAFIGANSMILQRLYFGCESIFCSESIVVYGFPPNSLTNRILERLIQLTV